MSAGPELAVVIAARDEAARLPLLLADLGRCGALALELVVVDGGSTDGTAAAARLAGARVLRHAPGRGAQLASGVAATTAPWLLLLHADLRLPPDWAALVSAVLSAATSAPRPGAWYFDLAIAAPGPGLRLVELAVALRSRWRQRPYGDQGLLLPRRLLEAAGGVPPLQLMEDLALVQRLRRLAPLRPLGGRLLVDGRRWQRLGVVGATLANARLRRAWRRGVSADELAARYGAYQKAQRRAPGSSCQPWAW